MAKIFEIKFGPKNKIVTGETISDALVSQKKEYELKLGRELTKEECSNLTDAIVSQEKNEKGILCELCQIYASNNQSIDTLIDMQDIVKEIKSAEGVFRILETDLAKIKSDEVMKKVRPEQFRVWMLYTDLFLQIKNPVEVKINNKK